MYYIDVVRSLRLDFFGDLFPVALQYVGGLLAVLACFYALFYLSEKFLSNITWVRNELLEESGWKKTKVSPVVVRRTRAPDPMPL